MICAAVFPKARGECMAMLGLLSAYAQLDAQAEESGEYYSTLMVRRPRLCSRGPPD